MGTSLVAADRSTGFLFGNALGDNDAMVDNVMYAKLLSSNCRWFDFEGCVFSTSNMYRAGGYHLRKVSNMYMDMNM